MTVFNSSWNAHGTQAQTRREAMLARIAQLRALEDRAAQASAKSGPVFTKRGQLLPRERVALLLDPGTPYLPLCSLAGFMQDTKDPLASVPGGGMVAGSSKPTSASPETTGAEAGASTRRRPGSSRRLCTRAKRASNFATCAELTRPPPR